MEEQTTKKRKARNVTRACENCRTKHLKCDGKDPCIRCLQLNADCIYDANQSKRGPARVRHLEDQLQILQERLVTEMNKNKRLSTLNETYPVQSKSPETTQTISINNNNNNNNQNMTVYANTSRSTFSNYPLSLSRDLNASCSSMPNENNKLEIPQTVSSLQPAMIVQLLEDYNELCLPFFGVVPPLIDISDYLAGKVEHRLSMLMSSMLANAAAVSGNVPLAMELVQRCNIIMRNYFLQMDPYVAATHSLLSGLHFLCGQSEEGNLCNAMSLSVSKSLLLRGGHTEEMTILLNGIYAQSLLRTLGGAASMDSFLAIVSDLKEFCNKNVCLNGDFVTFISFIARVRFLVLDSDTQGEALVLLDQAHMYIPQASPLVRRNFHAMLMALRAVLYHNRGNPALAIKFSNEAFRILQLSQEKVSPLLTFVMAVVVQIHLYENCEEEVQKDIEFLQHFSGFFPILNKIKLWLESDPIKRKSMRETEPLWRIMDLHHQFPKICQITLNPMTQFLEGVDRDLSKQAQTELKNSTPQGYIELPSNLPTPPSSSRGASVSVQSTPSTVPTNGQQQQFSIMAMGTSTLILTPQSNSEDNTPMSSYLQSSADPSPAQMSNEDWLIAQWMKEIRPSASTSNITSSFLSDTSTNLVSPQNDSENTSPDQQHQQSFDEQLLSTLDASIFDFFSGK